jgi:hypothetical protein
MSASVKVMRSYDYCHFEICLSMNFASVPRGSRIRRSRNTSLPRRWPAAAYTVGTNGKA